MGFAEDPGGTLAARRRGPPAGPARRSQTCEGNWKRKVSERPSKASVSRRHWTTVSNAAKRSSEIRPEKCPLDLVTCWLLSTLARAASEGGEGKTRPSGVRKERDGEELEM